jgi:peptidoglycan/LPS O-acetylase OafA/YrhL
MAYLVFPLITLVTAAIRRLRWQLVAIAALGLCFYYLIFCLPERPNYSFGAGAAVRVLVGAAIGSLLRRLCNAKGLDRVPWSAIFWLGLPLAALTMTTLDGARRPDNIWAWLAMPACLLIAANAQSSWMLPLTSRPAVFLGEISYAVYILHYPVLRAVRVLLRPELEKAALTASDAAVCAVFFGLFLVVILFAALARASIELPVRNWARRGIDRL